MFKFAIELKNPQSGSMLRLRVDADTAMAAIKVAKVWNPGYSEMVSCQMIEGNF